MKKLVCFLSIFIFSFFAFPLFATEEEFSFNYSFAPNTFFKAKYDGEMQEFSSFSAAGADVSAAFYFWKPFDWMSVGMGINLGGQYIGKNDFRENRSRLGMGEGGMFFAGIGPSLRLSFGRRNSLVITPGIFGCYDFFECRYLKGTEYAKDTYSNGFIGLDFDFGYRLRIGQHFGISAGTRIAAAFWGASQKESRTSAGITRYRENVNSALAWRIYAGLCWILD